MIRNKGNGESKEWYKLAQSNKGNYFKSTNSIKDEGKLVTLLRNVSNIRYTFDVELQNTKTWVWYRKPFYEWN